MQIIDYFQSREQDAWLNQIGQVDWVAAKFLAQLLRESRFRQVLGEGTLYLLVDGDTLVSFVTLTHQDCIDDETLYPWLGFFYTFPEYRGHRLGGRLLDFAVRRAGEQGYPEVYIATDHLALYEKYGFTYMRNQIDVYGTDSRIYIRKTEEIL